jgi:hypothetical protein
MNSKELTPVDWFLNELLENNIIKTGDVDLDSYRRAKKMEKERLYKFYIQGGVDACTGAKRNVEDYYNETFKQQGK